MREDEIKKLIRILDENEGITEIEMAVYPLGGRKIRVSRRGAGGTETVVRSHPAATAAPLVEGEPDQSPDVQTDLHQIKAPMVGTFYRSPNPDADPFVSEGSSVSPGSVLCIVEAMKLMNEIECDVAGTIREIKVENGTPIEFGQVLYLIERE